MGLSWWHLFIVIAAFVLLFGAGRISALMGDVAKGLKSFNKAMAEEDETERFVKTVESNRTKPVRSRTRSASR
jgi:sec-independent protein translocase protein TatA